MLRFTRRKKSEKSRKEWESKGLSIFFLPTDSPQLNPIEIVGRFLKYKWLQSNDYQDWETFVKALENILKEFGNKYIINFA
jgi:transposase